MKWIVLIFLVAFTSDTLACEGYCRTRAGHILGQVTSDVTHNLWGWMP